MNPLHIFRNYELFSYKKNNYHFLTCDWNLKPLALIDAAGFLLQMSGNLK